MNESEDYILLITGPASATFNTPEAQGASGPSSKKAKKARNNKTVMFMLVGFLCNVPSDTDEGLIKVHELMRYTFPLEFAVLALLLHHSNSNDEEVIILALAQGAGQGEEDDNGDDEYASKYEYQEKQAHNKKVDHKIATDKQPQAAALQKTNDSHPEHLSQGWEMMLISGCWECHRTTSGACCTQTSIICL
ncbi:hypothetical protein C0995_013740 [Termitomyces sp. Mi166|nr:hypothetical protein C0995_013740 [Termitomyces sp. Mi166\